MDNNDVVAARRRALQEAIHSGETVMVSPTGQVQLPGESDDPTRPGISVPQGKLCALAKRNTSFHLSIEFT